MTFRKFNNIEYPVPGVDTALDVLRPRAKYDISFRSGIHITEWEDEENRLPPTSEEIGQEMLRQHKIYDYYEYERLREKDFPEIKDQLDLLYHDIKNGNLNNGEWIKSIEKVKMDHPKPTTPLPE